MAKAWKGTKKVISEIRRFGAEAEQKINLETQNIAFQIERDAKQRAPKNFGKLAQSISHSRASFGGQKLIRWMVTVNEPYAAYMEFGTGAKVQVPAEFKNMANSFKGATGRSFKDGLEAIRIWCRHKGIDEKAAYPIFAKILGAGVRPQPFLFPAWVKGKEDYQKNLKQLLKSLKRNI